MAAHRYWRVSLTAAYTGATFFYLDRMRLWQAPFGVGGSTVNVHVVSTAATQTAGGTTTAGAYDDALGTPWNSNDLTTPEYVSCDFGAGNAYDINALSFIVGASTYPGLPYSGLLQYSDDNSTWFTELTWADPRGVGYTPNSFETINYTAISTETATVSQTLPKMNQAAVLADKSVIVSQTLPKMNQVAALSHIPPNELVTVAQTLPKMSQAVQLVDQGHAGGGLRQFWTFQ